MPGSTVTTPSATRTSSDLRPQARLLVHLHAEAVTEPVREELAEPSAAITSRATASTSRPICAGDGRRQARVLGAQADLVGARRAPRGAHRSRTSACSPSCSRRPARRRRRRPSGRARSPRGSSRVRRRAVRPAATITSNAGPSAPSSCIVDSIHQARSRSVRPDERCSASRCEDLVGDRGGRANRVELGRLLDRTAPSRAPRARDELDPAAVEHRPRRVGQVLRPRTRRASAGARPCRRTGRERPRPPPARAAAPSRRSGSR